MSDFVSKCCKNCPFAKDVRPFLRPERAEDLAYSAQNPFNTFHCHETTVSDDSSETGDILVVESTKICAGFLSLMHNENGETFYDQDGFSADPRAYDCAGDMIYAYEEQHEVEQEKIRKRMADK